MRNYSCNTKNEETESAVFSQSDQHKNNGVYLQLIICDSIHRQLGSQIMT